MSRPTPLLFQPLHRAAHIRSQQTRTRNPIRTKRSQRPGDLLRIPDRSHQCMNTRGMNGRKEIRKIESNHHRFTSMRRRISHGTTTFAKSMHAFMRWNLLRQVAQNLPLYTPQTRLRSLDQPTSFIAFFNCPAGLMKKRRIRTLRHDAPPICKPVKIGSLDFQPGGQIAEHR